MTSSGVANLASKGSECLRTLRLTHNQLDEAAIQQLVQGKWLQLQHLDLSDNILTDAAIEHLVKGNWPLSVKRNCVTFRGLLRLPAAQWPCTESLVVTTEHQQPATRLLSLASVVIQFDTNCIVFTTDKHTAKHVSFDTCTSRYKDALLDPNAVVTW